MRLLYLTAGAAGMYCGSCMHDNSLARSLMGMGTDMLLVPVYTPIRTDDEDVSQHQVFFGGLNIYLQQKFPWLQRLPAWMDRWLNHPSLIRFATRGAMQIDMKFLGRLTLSMLRGMEGNQRKELARMLDWLQTDFPPSHVMLTNLLIGGCIPELKRRTQARCFVTLQGDDIFVESLPEPYRSQVWDAMRELVPFVDGFVFHSQEYAAKMASRLQIPDRKQLVIPLGVDITDFANRTWSPPTGPLKIGYMARKAPEKGLDLLVEAYCRLRDRVPQQPLELLLAGWEGPQHAEYLQGIRQRLDAAGYRASVSELGDIDRQAKLELFQQIDVLCVPTRYQEPKGLFVLEAAAAGIPYVLPAHGAFPEVDRRLKNGLLFPPEEVDALTNALQAILPTLRNGNRQQAATSAQGLVDIRLHAASVLDWMKKG